MEERYALNENDTCFHFLYDDDYDHDDNNNNIRRAVDTPHSVSFLKAHVCSIWFSVQAIGVARPNAAPSSHPASQNSRPYRLRDNLISKVKSLKSDAPKLKKKPLQVQFRPYASLHFELIRSVPCEEEQRLHKPRLYSHGSRKDTVGRRILAFSHREIFATIMKEP